MNENITNDLLETSETEETSEVREFVLDEAKFSPVSSAEAIKAEEILPLETNNADDVILPEIPSPKILAISEETTSAEEVEKAPDPIFAELAEPKLPELEKENRARLQMQSPSRVYFYWSVKNNPYQTLSRVFGNRTNYQLVAKFVNQTQEREEIFPVEAEGNWWFETDANSSYRAEIGFYAPNRPFIRVLCSNTIETPRKNPSPRRAESKDWAVSANQFAKVLDVAGFSQDAFEVAFAGDNIELADNATQNAFTQLVGAQPADSVRHDLSEVRYALIALASGIKLENLHEQVSASLFNRLQEQAEKMSAENALAALQENFGEFDEEIEETFSSSAVFGASLVNFPKTSKRKTLSKFSPISSLRS